MSLTLEEVNSLIAALGVAIPAEYLRQKEVEARFAKRCAAIRAEFPNFKEHHSGARAEEMLNTAGMLAGRQRNFQRPVALLDELEMLLRSPVPLPQTSLPKEEEQAKARTERNRAIGPNTYGHNG